MKTRFLAFSRNWVYDWNIDPWHCMKYKSFEYFRQIQFHSILKDGMRGRYVKLAKPWLFLKISGTWSSRDKKYEFMFKWKVKTHEENELKILFETVVNIKVTWYLKTAVKRGGNLSDTRYVKTGVENWVQNGGRGVAYPRAHTRFSCTVRIWWEC